MKRLKILCFIVISLWNFNLFASTYTVINTQNSGIGSLNDAITNANSHQGTDTVTFNIPLTDAGYTMNGVWTINLTSALPVIADISGGSVYINGNSQTTNQGNTNTYGPEIIIHNGSNLLTCFVIATANNFIKGLTINGFTYGITFYNSFCTNCTISDMYIGTNYDGTNAVPNMAGVAFSNGASNNNVINCLISGNSNYGIAVSGSNHNYFKGNKIGTDRTGTVKLPNNFGIVIDTSSENVIGGGLPQDMNLISGNLTAGIGINGGSSSNNQIYGNYIGTDINGSDSLPNGCGIILAGARNTVVGGVATGQRNIISGNYQAGIVMNGTGTRFNTIKGNYIGTNKDGNGFVSNHTGVMLKSNCNQNTIGGSTPDERNIISGNLEIGVYIEACDSNMVKGNYLGPDISGNGTFMLGDSAIQGNGIELNTVSKYNIVGGTTLNERNVISGNRVYGLVYYGNSSYNNTSGNYIGVNATGDHRLSNATGICVDGGSNHNIINNNILSGNKSYGIFFVTTGTYYNEFKGNKVGINATNTDTIPNYTGVVIAAGTRYNVIGGTGTGEANIISGNYYDGIEISDLGTDHNLISGNIIGASTQGGFGNYNGIGIATNPRNNVISYNTISGNKYMGIILFEHADSNQIDHNNIGVLANEDSCGNGAAGIVIVQGSSYNLIGPGNTIVNNDTAGIIINDNNTLYNTITESAVFNNGISQIDIFPPGPNANDPGDADSGPNLMMNHPDILSTGYNPLAGITYITGTIDYNYQNPGGIVIEVFCSYTDSAGTGKCMKYLGNTLVDSTGNWVFFANNIEDGDSIVATATDIDGNTSEISPGINVITSVNEFSSMSPEITLFPNPASNAFNVKITVNDKNSINMSLFDIHGRFNEQLADKELGPGENILHFDTDRLAQGLYFLRIKTETGTFTHKLSIIR